MTLHHGEPRSRTSTRASGVTTAKRLAGLAVRDRGRERAIVQAEGHGGRPSPRARRAPAR